MPLEYIYPGAVPLEIGFCSDEKSYFDEVKRLECDDDKFIIDKAAANVKILHDGGYALICIDPEKLLELELCQLIGLICHEAMHILDHIISEMREKRPGKEFKAYTIQYIVQCASTFFLRERKKLQKKKRK